MEKAAGGQGGPEEPAAEREDSSGSGTEWGATGEWGQSEFGQNVYTF